MKLALKADSPQKQKRTIEKFIKRQEAHQKRKEKASEHAEREFYIGLTSPARASKSPNRANSTSKSRDRKSHHRNQDESQTTPRTLKKIKLLHDYIEDLRNENQDEVADEY